MTLGAALGVEAFPVDPLRRLSQRGSHTHDNDEQRQARQTHHDNSSEKGRFTLISIVSPLETYLAWP